MAEQPPSLPVAIPPSTYEPEGDVVTQPEVSCEAVLLALPDATEAIRIWCLEHPSLCALADHLSAFYGTLPADPTRDQRYAPWRAQDDVYAAERVS